MLFSPSMIASRSLGGVISYCSRYLDFSSCIRCCHRLSWYASEYVLGQPSSVHWCGNRNLRSSSAAQYCAPLRPAWIAPNTTLKRFNSALVRGTFRALPRSFDFVTSLSGNSEGSETVVSGELRAINSIQYIADSSAIRSGPSPMRSASWRNRCAFARAWLPRTALTSGPSEARSARASPP